MATGSDDGLPLWFKLGIALAVLAVWFASVLFDMASTSYETPVPIHAIAAIVVTYIFGKEVGRAVRDRIDS